MKNKWFRSIRIRLPAIIVLVILLPIIAFWYFYNNTAMENLIENTKSSMYTNMYGASLRMEDLLDEVSAFSQTLSDDKQFIALINEFRNAPYKDRMKVKSALTLALSQYLGQLRTMDSIFLIFGDKNVMLTSMPADKEIAAASQAGGRYFSLYNNYFKNHIGWYTLPSLSDETVPSLSYVRPVEIGGQGDNCMLVCNVKSSYWEEIMGLSYVIGGSVKISDYQGNLLLSSEGEWVFGENIKERGEYNQAFGSQETVGWYFADAGAGRMLTVYYNSVEAGWKYISTLPLKDIQSGLGGQMTFMLIIFGLAVFSALLGSLLLFFSIVKPVNMLMRKMRGMENGVLEPVEEIRQKDEIGVLLQSYNHMIMELKKLIDEAYVQEILTKQAQLKSLQSQMDEHFLYNTINTIYCEACREKADNSAQMLIVLSKYFRLSLSKGKDKVKLSEIVEYIRYYLLIQRMRFSDKLTVNIDACDGLEAYVALKYLFQPIVENAIVHGFEKRRAQCNVDITLRIEGALLYFEVKDNGAGMDAETLEKIREELRQLSKVEGEGYALKNVQEQIYITYGRQYSIQIESEQGKGTKVCFYIPLERSDEVE